MKKGLIALLLLSIFLLSACAPKFSDEQILKDPEGALKTCEGVGGEQQNNCFLRVSDVVGTTNLAAAMQACSSVKDDNSKRGCFDQLIKKQNDTDSKLEVCKNVGFPDMERGCLEDLAKVEKDAKKAMSICNEIKDDNNFREHCLNLVVGSSSDVDVRLSACGLREGMDKDNCYQGIGTSLFETNPSKGMEVCNKISDKSTRNNCLNFFMSSPELIKANPSLAIEICDSMSLKDNCYRNVGQTLSATDPKKATDVCKKLSDEIQMSDCFNNVWFSFNSRITQDFDFSMSLCASLNLKKDDCYRRVSEAFIDVDKTKAEQACNMMSAAYSQGCLNNIRR